MDLNLDNYFPTISKRNIVSCVHAKDGETTVIKTKYTGNRNTFLNETATFIFDLIINKSGISVKKIVKTLMKKYDTDDEERVIDDTMNALKDLWKLTIVRWNGINPFEKVITKLSNGDRIISASHDIVPKIKIALKSANYQSPFFEIKNLNTDLITMGLVTGITPTYMHLSSNNEVNSVLMIDLLDEVSNIIFLSDNGFDFQRLNTIFEAIFEHTNVKALLLNMSKPIICNLDAYKQLGFEYAGTLKNETKDGDIIVYGL